MVIGFEMMMVVPFGYATSSSQVKPSEQGTIKSINQTIKMMMRM
jgi:hypothetical protein